MTAMKKSRLLISAGCAALLLSACTPTYNVRGNLLENEETAKIQPGVDTTTDVLRKIGSPTTKAPFDDKTWYYIGQDTEKHGILDPKVVKERIFEVKFNDQGIVETAQDIHNKREDVPLVRDKTPTSGSEMTVMQQFLGNMGKFNKEGMQDDGVGHQH
jgi:outer membrane protein assembly factor BamE (lipoprotein component of BamABCDE complex)